MAQYALDDLTFNFVPEGLPMPELEVSDNPDQTSANDIYRQAHKMVYNVWPKNDLGKNWQAAVSNAKSAQMDFKTFCLYIITGFMVTHDTESKFFPANLSNRGTLEKVEGYRKACLRKFGAADARSLGLMLNLTFYDIDEEMFLSEVSFGRYVVGHVLSGTKDICKSVYEHDEISFSPYWLNIEGTYIDYVFAPYIKAVETTPSKDKHTLGNPAQLRHRHLVSQVRSALRRRSHLASTIFASRSRIMPKAVKSVLDRHGIKKTEKISDTVNIDDAYTFWRGLGEIVANVRQCNGFNTV